MCCASDAFARSQCIEDVHWVEAWLHDARINLFQSVAISFQILCSAAMPPKSGWTDVAGRFRAQKIASRSERCVRRVRQYMGLNSLRDLFPESSDDPEGHQEAIAYNRKHMLPTPEGTQILSKMQNF